MVDCSIGTPYDPPPAAVVEALASSGTERGYPASAGSPALREAAAAWLARRFGCRGPAVVGRRLRGDQGVRRRRCRSCCGSATRSATPCCSPPCPIRPTPWGRSWPAAAPSRSRPPRRLGGLELDAIDPRTPGAPCCCGRTRRRTRPAGLGDLGAEAAWGRAHGVPVFSDECYAEFTWDGPPRSVLQHGPDGVVAVHSLSKRSNLAGVRVGFYAGDAELVEFLRAVRQHAGLMVPGPAQAAGVAALADDDHVEVAARALPGAPAPSWPACSAATAARPCFPRAASTCGCPCPPVAGPTPGAWPRRWPTDGGLLVSPGDLYGDDGAGHVRVAVVQPMERLALVGERLARVRHG